MRKSRQRIDHGVTLVETLNNNLATSEKIMKDEFIDIIANLVVAVMIVGACVFLIGFIQGFFI